MQSPPWLPSLVWTDYRLALLFTVICPLALLIWAFVEKSEAVQRLLFIYWRVASLIAIAIYLMIGAVPVGFFAGWFARILIPISLWFWVDLNEEIAELPQKGLGLAVRAWRWAISVYCILSAIGQVSALRCAFLPSKEMVDQPFCRVWLDAPWVFREFFNAGMKPYTLGLLASLALGVYVVYLAYFVFVRLGKQGRSATGL
jgi:hypothetical protein